MNILNHYIAEYMEYCKYRKRLDTKTIKAYRSDLTQYENYCSDFSDSFSKSTVDRKRVVGKIVISRQLRSSST